MRADLWNVARVERKGLMTCQMCNYKGEEWRHMAKFTLPGQLRGWRLVRINKVKLRKHMKPHQTPGLIMNFFSPGRHTLLWLVKALFHSDSQAPDRSPTILERLLGNYSFFL